VLCFQSGVQPLQDCALGLSGCPGMRGAEVLPEMLQQCGAWQLSVLPGLAGCECQVGLSRGNAKQRNCCLDVASDWTVNALLLAVHNLQTNQALCDATCAS
jgi:hypothetical protein